MKRVLRSTVYFLWFCLFLMCTASCAKDRTAAVPSGAENVASDGRLIICIGQDLVSVSGYTDSGLFPVPGAVTSYTSLPDLNGLYEKADWGSGPVSAVTLAEKYTDSALSLGVYMADDKWNPRRLERIAGGLYDSRITALADFIAGLHGDGSDGKKPVRRTVYLRLGYEFDGVWNHYDPASYIAAFRHIADIIRPVAPNAVFVWQACTSPVNEIIRGTHADIRDWYPGDDYADMAGLSWFLSRDSVQTRTADEIVSFARERKKSVMICESAPQGYDLGKQTKRNISPVYDGKSGDGLVHKSSKSIWNEWYVPFFDFIYQNDDVIRVVAYINCSWDSQPKWSAPYAEGYWGDSRLEKNRYIAAKWKKETAKPVWVRTDFTDGARRR